MSVNISDPLFLLSAQTGMSVGELAAKAAEGTPDVEQPQQALKIGEPIPLIFTRRRNSNGGVMVQPKMTEAFFANPIIEEEVSSGSSTFRFFRQTVQVKYLLILSEGCMPQLRVKDLFHGNCRRGSFNQVCNGRAGTWTPGNDIDEHFDYVATKNAQGAWVFDLSTLANGESAKVGNTVYYKDSDGILTNQPYREVSFPAFTGRSGSYSGLTTLSFEYTVTDSQAAKIDKSISAFVRNGLQVTRLVDGATGESDNFADLAKYLMSSNNRLPSDLIDTAALTIAAKFSDANGFLFNGELKNSQSLLDWLQHTSVNFLLRTTNSGGKFGLKPRLPYNTDFTIKTTQITPGFTFTEEHVVDGGFQVEYIGLEDRDPVCFVVSWRQQPEANFGIVRTIQVRYTGEAANGPFVNIDMSDYCTSEDHAVKVGTYHLAQRKSVTHHLRLTVRERSYNASLVVGDLVRVRLRRETSEGNAEYHDKVYEINRIEKSFEGVIVYDLTHFPVDSQGRSIVARQVDAATGEGNIIDVGRSDFSCDENGDDDDSDIPDDDGGGNTPPDNGDTEKELPQPPENDTPFPEYPGFPDGSPDAPGPEDPLEKEQKQYGIFLPYEKYKANTEQHETLTMLTDVENESNAENLFYVGTSGSILLDIPNLPYAENYVDTYSINTDSSRNHIGRIYNLEDYTSDEGIDRYLKSQSAFHPRASDIGKRIEVYVTNKNDTSQEVFVDHLPSGVTDSGLTYDWCNLEYEITTAGDLEWQNTNQEVFNNEFPNHASKWMNIEGTSPSSEPSSGNFGFVEARLGEGGHVLSSIIGDLLDDRPLNHIWSRTSDGGKKIVIHFNIAAFKIAFPSERYIELEFFPSFITERHPVDPDPTVVAGSVSAKFFKGGQPASNSPFYKEANGHTVTATKTQSVGSFSYSVSSVIANATSNLDKLLITNASDRSIRLDTQDYEFTSG